MADVRSIEVSCPCLIHVASRCEQSISQSPSFADHFFRRIRTPPPPWTVDDTSTGRLTSSRPGKARAHTKADRYQRRLSRSQLNTKLVSDSVRGRIRRGAHASQRSRSLTLIGAQNDQNMDWGDFEVFSRFLGTRGRRPQPSGRLQFPPGSVFTLLACAERKVGKLCFFIPRQKVGQNSWTNRMRNKVEYQRSQCVFDGTVSTQRLICSV